MRVTWCHRFRPWLGVVLLGMLTGVAAAATTNANRKALVLGQGDPVRDPGGGATHAQGAKGNFLRFVGNPSNDPAKGWTCDLSWDVMERAGLDPRKTTPEELFTYIGKHGLGYRIVIQNLARGANAPFWGAAVDNGMMPFAAHGDNTPNLRLDDPVGLKACVSVGGGMTAALTTYGPGLEFFDAVPDHSGFGEDAAQSWASQMLAAKFAKILDRHPEYNLWDAREHLRQAASGWSDGWTERNGYGRVNLNARVGTLQPGPPVEFEIRLARTRREVLFRWRNFAMSDFAATVIARTNGEILYQGTGTNFNWVTDADGPQTFQYWSVNQAGEKSRLESFQTRPVKDISYAGEPACLVLADPGTAPEATELLGTFGARMTNWVCDLACRPNSPQAPWVQLYWGTGPFVTVQPDYPAMVDYAVTRRYRLVLVPATESKELESGGQEAAWKRAWAANIAVVTPHSPRWPESPAERRQAWPERLGAAITVAWAAGTNGFTCGPGLEFIDAAPAPAQLAGAYDFSANAAAALLAARLAGVLTAHPDYNGWDARQYLRQSASHYAAGWTEEAGYGRPAETPAPLQQLDLAPPLAIHAVRAADGRSVSFSWLNFRQTDFAETVIERSDGTPIYRGDNTHYIWRSEVTGAATFRFYTRGQSGRRSRDEPYTVVRVEGLVNAQGRGS